MAELAISSQYREFCVFAPNYFDLLYLVCLYCKTIIIIIIIIIKIACIFVQSEN